MKLTFTENETKLVRLCKKGDAKAQYKLYNLYAKGMYNVAIRMTNDKNLAEDVLQDAFIKAFLEIKKLQNEKAFGGWLKRIIINLCIDVSRKKNLVFTDMETVPVQDLQVENEVESSIDPEYVHLCIKRLPEGARQILVLRALEGYKHAEIAERMGISESTAKTQFFRAKQLLTIMMNSTKEVEKHQQIG